MKMTAQDAAAPRNAFANSKDARDALLHQPACSMLLLLLPIDTAAAAAAAAAAAD